MRTAGSGFTLTWSPNREARWKSKPSMDEPNSRSWSGHRATATSMRCWRSTAITSATASKKASTIATRRSPTICATGARTCATVDCRIWRRPLRRGRWLCLCGAVPQTAGLSLQRQALDLHPSRAHRPRHRTAAAAGTDRRLRGGGLPPDHRLYRRRQCGLTGPSRKVRFFPGRAACRAWPIAMAAGPTASWCSARLAVGSTEPPPPPASFGR